MKKEGFTLLDLKIIYNALKFSNEHSLSHQYYSIDSERVLNKVKSRITKIEKELKERAAKS